MSKIFKLPSSPTIGREEKLQRLLCNLNNKVFFSSEQYKNIYTSGSQPARLYGNAMTHKLKPESDKLSFRPLVASMGAYNYKLTKFLLSIMDLVISGDHSTKDSFLLCKEIKILSFSDEFLITYKICILLLVFLSRKQFP